MSATFTKAVRVLDLQQRDDSTDVVEFTSNDPGCGVTNRTLELTVDDWRNLGCPDKVTVTIEPGNTLQEEADAAAG